ncbi:MAG: helicase-related protein [Xenophilus sp.]
MTPAQFPPPRDFQAAAHEALRQGIRDGHCCQMLCAPTGAGKTYLGLRIINEAQAKGRRAIFVCDRVTLIDQTSATADRYGLSDHGVIQADHWRTDYSKKFQIASAQTLERRQWPEADVIVVDEAHTQLGAWVRHIPTTRAAVIGLSATPFSPGLGKLFSNLVNAATMDELTRSGVLVPMRVLSCTRPDMAGAATSGGEWTDTAAAERGMAIIGDVVTEWLRFGENRKTIVFGSTIAHCEELCRQFNEAGVMAAVFTSRTSKTEREALLREYRKADSTLRVLVSVEALAKGFDVPDVGCVVDCRPLRKSLSTCVQMWGRGLRSAPGKADCILLDHSGNILRFAQDFEQLFFHGAGDLSTAEKMDKSIRRDAEGDDAKGCPACGFKPFRQRCMACGHEARNLALVEHEAGGEMREIVIGKTKAADSPAHLWQQVCAYARSHGNPDKRQGRAAHLYKDIAGSWPPDGWHIDSTPFADISRAVLGKIRSRNIAFAKTRRAVA